MNALFPAPASISSEDPASVVLPEQIDKVLESSVMTLHGQLKDLVAGAISTLNSNHERQLDAAHQGLALLQAEADHACGMFEAEQRAHAQTLVQNAALETRVEKSDREFQALLQEREQFERELAERLALHQADSEALESLNEEAKQLSSKLGEAQDALVKLETRLANAESETLQARTQFEQLEQHHAASIETSQTQMRELDEALDDANSQVGEMKIRAWNLETEVEELRGNNEEMSGRLSSHNQHVDELSRNLELAIERERKSAKLIGEAKQVLSESKQTIAQLEAKLREARSETTELRKELVYIKSGAGLPPP